MTDRITLALQPERDAEALMEQAIGWAQRLGAHLHLVTAVPLHLPTDPLHLTGDAQDVTEGALENQLNLGTWLEDLLETIPEPVRGTSRLLTGEAVPELKRHITTGVLAVGTHHRRDLVRLFLGSVSEKLARDASVPVLVLPTDAPHVPHPKLRVHLPVDPDDPDFIGVAWAKRHLPGAALTAVFRLSWTDTFSRADEAAYDEALGELRASLDSAGHQDVPCAVVVREESNDGEAIAREAAVSEVDLVVMPTHGRTGLAHLLLGSVTERVVRAASCPVLVVR